MRQDLDKVMVDRERYNSGASFKAIRRSRMFEQQDTYFGGRESMKYRHKRAPKVRIKQFNEHLNPLRGVLKKNVGRKWDTVYSELRQAFDPRKVINQHIFEHLFDYVQTNTYRATDGSIMFMNRWGRAIEIGGYWRRGRPNYYVHPETGILCDDTKEHKAFEERRKRKQAEAARANAKFCRKISPTLVYQRIDENEPWFACTISPVPKPVLTRVPYYHRREDGSTEMRYTEQMRTPHYFDKWNSYYSDYLYNKDRKEWNKLYSGMGTTNQYSRRRNTFHYPMTYVSNIRTANKKELRKHGLIK